MHNHRIQTHYIHPFRETLYSRVNTPDVLLVHSARVRLPERSRHASQRIDNGAAPVAPLSALLQQRHGRARAQLQQWLQQRLQQQPRRSTGAAGTAIATAAAEAAATAVTAEHGRGWNSGCNSGCRSGRNSGHGGARARCCAAPREDVLGFLNVPGKRTSKRRRPWRL